MLALACACVLAAVVLAVLPSTAGAAWSQLSQFNDTSANGELRYPRGMTVDGSGNVWVADTLNNRVQKFDSTGAFVMAFGSRGTGNGQFHQPRDVAIDGGGNILVADSYNDRIQRFSSAGTYLNQFGASGSANGSFSFPTGLAVDAGGNIYVSDTGNNRIQKFNSAGTYQSKFGTYGTGTANLDSPTGLAVKSDGTIYIVDTGNNRIKKLTAALAYSTQFGSQGGGSNQFQVPRDVDLDSSGNVYVADGWNGRVQKFNASHTFQSSVTYWGFSWGSAIEVSSVDVDASGNVFVLDGASDHVSKYDAAATFQFRFGNLGSSNIAYVTQMARASDGTIYAVDAVNERVMHYSEAGAVLHSWGTHGTGDGQFTAPYGIAVAPNGNVFVADAGNDRIQVFNSSGTFLSKFGSTGSGTTQVDEPEGMVFDGAGNLVVAECSNHRIHTFTQAGAHVAMFGTFGSGNGQLNCPIDVGVARDGSKWVVDENNYRVQRFDSSGVYQSQFGTPGSLPTEFTNPSGIGVAPNGDLFVSDYNLEKVNRYNSSGAYQETIGSSVGDMELTGWLGGGIEVVPFASNAFWMPHVGDNRISAWSNGAPNSTPGTPTGLTQYQSSGAPQIAAGGTSTGTSAKLRFSVADADSTQTLTPWVEIRPIGTPLSAYCGQVVAGVTFSGTPVAAPAGGVAVPAAVDVTALASSTDLHWRACSIDQTGTPSAWASMGGSDGTRDFATGGWAYLSRLGASGQNGQLLQPQGMALDGSGNVYIADTVHHRIQKFTTAGAYVSQFGTYGTGNGQFHGPTDVAVDSGGNVWVVDSGNNRVQRFDSAGAYVAKFGTAGTGAGQFNKPWGIATDAAGNVYVTDQNNHRFQKFNSAGTHQMTVGGTAASSANGQFDTPYGITIKSDNTIWVADGYNHRVQKFSAAGAYVTKFGTQGSTAGLMQVPTDVRIDSSANVWVADSGNSRIQRWSSAATPVYVSQFGGFGWQRTQFTGLRAVEVDASGNVYGLDPSHDRVLKFDSGATFLTAFGTSAAGEIAYGSQIARAPDGTMYVTDTANSRVLRYDVTGALLTSWGTYGTGTSQFRVAWGIAVGLDGSVYVSDSDSDNIEKFTATGTYLATIGSAGSGNGQVNDPNSLAVGPEGNLYVADCGNDRVDVFTPAGAYVAKFGTSGSGAGQFTCATDVEVADDGRIYVLEEGNDRVQIFNADYSYVSTFGSTGTGPGQWLTGWGFGLAPNGDVFVADRGNVINRFSSTGTYLERFGVYVDEAQTNGFLNPGDVLATASNSVYVTDNGNNRVSRWTTSGAPMTPPNSVANAAQFRTDGTTGVSAGTTTSQSGAVLKFDVSDTDGSQTLTPWVEIRPIGTPLSATCGASVAGVTFSGSTVAAAGQVTTYPASVSVAGLASGDYHWRACAVDQSGNAGRWVSFGGSNGTRDIGLDTTAPTVATIRDENPGSPGTDIDVQVTTTSLSGAFPAGSDSGSGFLNYDLCFTSDRTNGCAAAGRVNQSLAAAAGTYTPGSLSLVAGITYYACARARDAAGNVSAYSCSDGVQIASATMTVSGIATRDEYGTVWQGCDGAVQNIAMSVAGGPPTTASCNASTGAFSFPPFPTPTAGEPVVVYIDTASAHGATYYIANGGGTASNVELVQDRITLQPQGANANVDASTFQYWDGTDTSGQIPLDGASVSPNFVFYNDEELHLEPGITFTSGNHELNVGSVHVSTGARFIPSSDWDSSYLSGWGTSSDCSAGPGVAAPICVDPGGVLAPSGSTHTYFTFQPAVDRPVAIDQRVALWDQIFLPPGVDAVIGSSPSATPVNIDNIEVASGATLTSDPWDVDITAKTVNMRGSWTGSGAFDISTECYFSGDGTVQLPKADVRSLGTVPICDVGPGYATNDWVFHSMQLDSTRANHSFDGDGTVTWNSGGTNADTPGAVAQDQGNEYTYMVTTSPGSGTDWWISRYGSYNGALDTSWPGSGHMQISSAGADVATVATVADDGTLFVGGSMNGKWQLRAYDVYGALDPTFDGDGIWDTATENITGTPRALVIDQNDDIWLAGDETSGTAQWRVRRIARSGGAALSALSWNGNTGSGAQIANVRGMCTSRTEWGINNNVWVVGQVGAAGAKDWAIGQVQDSGSGWGWLPMLDGNARPGKITSAGTNDNATTCSTWYGSEVFVGGTIGNGGAADAGKLIRYDTNGANTAWTQNTWWGPSGDGTTTIDTVGVRDYISEIYTDDTGAFVLGGDTGGSGGRTLLRQLDSDGRTNTAFNSGTGYLAWDMSTGPDLAVDIQVFGGASWLTFIAPDAANGGDSALVHLDANGILQDNVLPGTSRYTVNSFKSAKLRLLGDLTVGDGSGTKNVLDLDRSENGRVDVSGSIDVRSDGALRAPSIIGAGVRVGGDLTLTGELYAGTSSEVVMWPRNRMAALRVSPTTMFENLTLWSPGGASTIDVDATDPIRVNGTFAATGTSCDQQLHLRPLGGASWTLNATMALVLRHLNLEHATFSPAQSVLDSYDGGSNSGVTFGGTSCATAGLMVPDTLRTNGVERPTDVEDTPAPTFTFTNRARASTDQADTRVYSSSPQFVQALWRMDGDGVDASGNGHHLVDAGGTPVSHGVGKFGQAAFFATAANGYETASMDMPYEFSVDGWLKRGAITGSDAPTMDLVYRGSAIGDHVAYRVYLDRGSNLLIAQMRDGAGEDYYVSVDAAPVLDDRWHHIAFTFREGGMHLYVDGDVVASGVNWSMYPDVDPYTTTLGSTVNGWMDDWQFREGAPDADEVRGMYRTGRRHLDLVWSQSAASTGTITHGSDVTTTYGGAAGTLAHDGARYWVQQRLRQANTSNWTGWSKSDWFATSLDTMTVAVQGGANKSVGAVAPGQDVQVPFAIDVTTDSELGWSLSARGESDAYALSNGLSGATNRIARRTTALWPAATAGYAGLTVTDAPGGKVTGTWGSGITPTDFANLRYTWPGLSQAVPIHTYSARSLATQTVTLSARVNPGLTTKPSAMTGRLEFTAVPDV